MAGRFEGLSDLEWQLFKDIFPPELEKLGKGMPHAPYRHVLNSLLCLLWKTSHLNQLTNFLW